MASIETICPPYEGEEPYLYLCFSNRDAKRIQPLLKRLSARGCRVWYPTGSAETVALRERRNERMNKASLLVLYQTRFARTDQSVKSAVLVCQAKGIPIISMDTDREESILSMGLDSRAVHMKARGIDAQETALLHAEGFSQELIGEPGRRSRSGLVKAAMAAWIGVILILGVAFAYFRLRPPKAPQMPVEEISFSDAELTAAVREALGGAPVTKETVSAITELRLASIPNEPEELAILPSLVRIEIPQSEAKNAAPLLDRYTIVLYGGVP